MSSFPGQSIKSDDDVAEHLSEIVLSKEMSGHAKASIPRLLRAANLMKSDLRQWCEGEFVRQNESQGVHEFGLDVFAGRIRPVVHSLLDALGSNQ